MNCIRNTFRARAARRLAGWSAIAAVVALSGCTRARVVDVWRDPEFTGAPLRALVVVAQRKDDIGRRLWEDAVTDAVSSSGVTAVPSYQDRPDGPLTKAQLSQALRAGSFDGALVVRPLADERDAHFVPGWTSYDRRVRYDPWRERPVAVLRPRYHRGYTVVDAIARTQVTLWAGGAEPRMVWAATVESTNPSSGVELRKDIATGLVPALVRERLLPAGAKGVRTRAS
jgi:hypothetical protein